ncbi:MAG: alpha-amylase family glycosyl hydrolase [Propionibacteriaceae bacterium]|nr:alpha-amylase family glycosyl hydrolase [Propionibacteriaceae bacterium]
MSLHPDPPAWAKTAIWWSVYPLGACGAPIREPADGSVHHRLRRLEAWLDHLVCLGCNGLALGPIWASSTHGYDIVDHLRIDPRLGDDQDFGHLLAACHDRGVKVLLDGVFNHVSSDHRAVRDVLAHGWDHPSAALLRSDPHRADKLSRFEGHDGLVELDHSHSAVADHVVQVMTHWLDFGADGWRLDAAYRVPATFWAGVLPRVRATHPEALVVAEILHGDYGAIADKASFDSVTQYELWKAIWSGLKDRNPHELAWALQRHEHTRGHEIPWTFVGNHDVTRIATQVGGGAAQVATAIVMTLSGTPAVYYGDELGWTGLKEERVGGDDQIRPALPDQPSQWTGEQAATIRATQLAIRLRRTHPWVAEASTEVVSCTQHILVWRSVSGPYWIEASLDVSEQPQLSVRDQTGDVLAVP